MIDKEKFGKGLLDKMSARRNADETKVVAAEPEKTAEEKPVVPVVEPAVIEPVEVKVIEPKPAAPAVGISYLAPGIEFEGLLRSKGDIELAGKFKGEITCQGCVTVRCDTESNITAAKLDIVNCKVVGDIKVSGQVSISEGSALKGNIDARDVINHGNVAGDIKATGNVSFGEKSRVAGNVDTGTMVVACGAVISGKVQTNVNGK